MAWPPPTQFRGTQEATPLTEQPLYLAICFERPRFNFSLTTHTKKDHTPNPHAQPLSFFLGHRASNMALIAAAVSRILSLPLKATLFIGAMFPKDAFSSTEMFSWPLNSIG